jgi:hypothetical protein
MGQWGKCNQNSEKERPCTPIHRATLFKLIERIKNHLHRTVSGSVEETLNALLDAEAERASICLSRRHHLESKVDGRSSERISSIAIAVNRDGYREILGICEGAKEVKSDWSALLSNSTPLQEAAFKLLGFGAKRVQ